MNTTNKTRKKQNHIKIISNETVHTFHCYRNDIRQYSTQELVCADNTAGLVNSEYIQGGSKSNTPPTISNISATNGLILEILEAA